MVRSGVSLLNSSMKLKDFADTVLIDPRKLTEYVLSPDSPKGKDKAFLFRKRLGYTQENYQALLAQIQLKALDAAAIPKKKDNHGQRYQVDLEIHGIRFDQKEIVRTGWIISPGTKQARLTTAYINTKP